MSNIEIFNQSVVVFSKNYLPLSRINIKKAIILLVTGKAEPVEFLPSTNWEIRSAHMLLSVPANIRLTISGGERLWKTPPVNRPELLRRDRHQCQYCGSKKQLTIDHIIPRSKGGTHTWENVVIACESCNCSKSDHTPKEAGLTLLTQPKPPIHPTLAFAERFWSLQQVK
jgi:5-methylcytosine-specific restriction endonuclease McrA